MTNTLATNTTAAPGTIRVPLTSIDLDASRAYWPRDKADDNRIKLFVELLTDNPHALPPVVLAPHLTEIGRYVVVDGNHRVRSWDQLGALDIEAIILPPGTDILLEATRRFLHSALPPKPGEKTRALKRLLENPRYENMGNSDFATEVGVSRQYVGRLRGRMAGETSFAQKQSTPAPNPFATAPSFFWTAQTAKDFEKIIALNNGVFKLMYGKQGASEADIAERWSGALNAHEDQERCAQILVNFEYYSSALARIVEAARRKAAATG